MAWYRNFYSCTDCGTSWEDEWSCCCDDECPNCGSGDWSPYESEDLTFLVEQEGENFVVFESPISAEGNPSYARIAVTPTADAASNFIKYRQAAYLGQSIVSNR
jgi:hypothetical protein